MCLSMIQSKGRTELPAGKYIMHGSYQSTNLLQSLPQMQVLKTNYCFIPWWRSWWPATSIFVNKLWECCPPRIATEWAVFHQFPQCERTNHVKTSGASKKKIIHLSVLRLQFLSTQTNFSSKMVQVEQMVSKLNRSDFQPKKFSSVFQ